MTISSLPPLSQPFTLAHLSGLAAWIRDDLDPQVAQDGPSVLHPNDVLTLHELFTRLLQPSIPLSMLLASRIHLAVMEIAGKATRWPDRLCDECDALMSIWKGRYGDGLLKKGRVRLWGVGGRLEGVCKKDGNLGRTNLLKFWRENSPELLDNERARRHGDLGFKAGQWWINGLFACHAGITDLRSLESGICFDKNGAYAVILKDNSEVEIPSEVSFTYRCRGNDGGRFRLTSADFRSRYPVRVLRTHDLGSFNAPRLGIRYDGLHRVIGWSIRGLKPGDKECKELVWEIRFERDQSETIPVQVVMKHPLAAEVDDYMEYKRLRREQRDRAMNLPRKQPPIAVSVLPTVQEIEPAEGQTSDPEQDMALDTQRADPTLATATAILQNPSIAPPQNPPSFIPTLAEPSIPFIVETTPDTFLNVKSEYPERSDVRRTASIFGRASRMMSLLNFRPRATSGIHLAVPSLSPSSSIRRRSGKAREALPQLQSESLPQPNVIIPLKESGMAHNHQGPSSLDEIMFNEINYSPTVLGLQGRHTTESDGVGLELHSQSAFDGSSDGADDALPKSSSVKGLSGVNFGKLFEIHPASASVQRQFYEQCSAQKRPPRHTVQDNPDELGSISLD